MSLQTTIATVEGKRRYVRTLFATIADRYDLITGLLSYGQDRGWKRRLVALAAPAAGTRALDLATGTGDIAFLLANQSVRAVGLDLTPGMIDLARAKRSTPGAPTFLVGDMMTLPFGAGTFDLVTTGYGLRNVPELTQAIDEIYRVLRSDGRVLSLDFNRPSNTLIRSIYLGYLYVVGGLVGWALHGDRNTYQYIPASIRTYPGAEAVVALMKARGFSSARYYPVLGGLMAIHDARK
jgi:demethylmenaquinone methyltransferase/2-methoxy-6-polyprenyl-1,4-benzoquinol methylase